MVKIQEEEKITEIPEIEAEDDTIIKVIFTMSKNTWKRLGEIALDRETSRASLVREAITQHLKTLEKPEEQNPKIPDRKLNRVLEECSNGENRFEIDGENGFIAFMETNEFLLKDLTPEQWERAKEKLNVGFSGYASKPSLEEFAEKFDVLEPTEEQREWLSTETEPTEEETTESE